MQSGKMTKFVRFISFTGSLALLGFSIYWSQDGFNFDLAGQSGYTDMAVIAGYGIAIVMTIVQFVFSTNFRFLNPSLLLFGIGAYVYSVYTNWQGIMHFQGTDPSKMGAFLLGLFVDGVPEPLLAWSLNESLTGDLVGNLAKALGSGFKIVINSFDAPGQTSLQNNSSHKPNSSSQSFKPVQQPKKGKGRSFYEEQRKPGGRVESLMSAMERDGAEPTYHPVGMSSNGESRRFFDDN